MARCGFLVEEALGCDLTGAGLLDLPPDLVRMSSAAGGAPSHRMIASRPGRSCFFSSAVKSSSIRHAFPNVVQSMPPFDIGGSFR